MSKKLAAEDFTSAQLLIDAGYTTHLKVQKASDEELLAIEGFGPASLASARAATAEGNGETDVAADVASQVANPVVVGQPVAAEQYQCKNPACGHLTSTIPCAYCGYVSQ